MEEKLPLAIRAAVVAPAVIEMYRRYHSLQDIATYHQIGVRAVKKILLMHKIRLRPRGRRTKKVEL